MWVSFFDLCSGGIRQTEYDLIFVEARSLEGALAIFKAQFSDPLKTTCTCCGPDYSIDTHETLEKALDWYTLPDKNYITVKMEPGQEEPEPEEPKPTTRKLQFI